MITITGLALAIAVPRALLILDRESVHSASADVAALLHSARSLALAGHTSVAVAIDSTAGVLTVRRASEVVLTRNVGEAHGVRMSGTRDSLAFDPHGLGHGAANLSIVIRRRRAVDTVFVSRFGRVR